MPSNPRSQPSVSGRPDAVAELLRFVSQAQDRLSQRTPGSTDPALLHETEGILQSLLRNAREQLSHVRALQACVDADPDPVLSLDGNLVCRYANPAAMRLLGATELPAAGRHLDALLGGLAGQDALRDVCRRALDGGVAEACTLSRVAPGGAAEDWTCAVTPVQDPGGAVEALLLACRRAGECPAQPTAPAHVASEPASGADDRLSELAWTNLALQAEITQRRRAEGALRANEARYLAMLNGADLGIALLDDAETITYVNPALAAIAGQPAEALRDLPVQDVIVRFGASAGAVQPLRERLAQAGGPVELDVLFARPDGARRWACITISTLPADGPLPPGVIVIVRDVTAERQAQAALLQAQKLTVTGQLAAALTHEVKNPLQSVIGSLGLIDELLDRGSPARLYLQVARQELRRADRILNRLHGLNKKVDRDDPLATDLMEVLRRVLVITEVQRQHQHVELQVEVEEGLPRVLAVPDQIGQVFMNLILNAIEAMPSGGLLAVRMENTRDPAGVSIAVCDTGIGISEDALPHVFDFLSSTKEHGTGLGLFVSRDIMRRHQGRIEVTSRLGEGTRFDLWLPQRSR